MCNKYRIASLRWACLLFLLSTCSSPEQLMGSTSQEPIINPNVHSPASALPTPIVSPTWLNTSLSPLPPTQTLTFAASPIQSFESFPSRLAKRIPPFPENPTEVDKQTSVVLGEVLQISDDQFEEVTLDSPLPVIVVFWAAWCPPCKMIDPLLNELAAEYRSELMIVRIDTDTYTETAMAYHVIGIPTLLFFRDGELIYRQSGNLPEELIRKKVIQFLKGGEIQLKLD